MDNFLLIVGAAKSGTTSLFRYLAEHPEISGSSPKEPHFFTDDEKLSKGWDWYRTLWQWDPDIHKVAMEASTGYTKLPYFPNAAERIARMPARFRFIYLMRNPLERIESHYGHGQVTKWETSKFEWNKDRVSEDLINVSRYAKQISEYYERFLPSSIKLIMFEDLVDRKADTLRDICEFLEVDSTHEFQMTNRSYNRRHERITSPFLRKLNKTWAVQNIKSVLPYAIKQGAKHSVAVRPGKEYVLSPRAREETLERLKPDLIRLRDEFGVGIQRWGIDI